MESLVSGLDKGSLIRGLQTKDALSKGEMHEKIKQLIDYWKDARGSNNVWAGKDQTKSQLIIFSKHQRVTFIKVSSIDLHILYIWRMIEIYGLKLIRRCNTNEIRT